MNKPNEYVNGRKKEYWGKQEKRGCRCEKCGGEGVCEYVVGKIEEGKKKEKKKKKKGDLWLVNCDAYVCWGKNNI